MKFEYERHGTGTGAVITAGVVVILITGAAYFIVFPGSPSSTTTITTMTSTYSSTTTTGSSTTTSTTGATSSTTSASSTTVTSSGTSSSSTTSSTTTTSTITSTSSSGPTQIIYLPAGIGGNPGLNFVPSTVTVAPGTTIIFVNDDTRIVHNVDFTGLPSGVILAQNPSPNSNKWTNNTFSVTLTTAGVYKYICDYHPSWMIGTITVKE
jgi:plastocyanin